MRFPHFPHWLPILFLLFGFLAAGVTFSTLQKKEHNNFSVEFQQSCQSRTKIIEKQLLFSQEQLLTIRNSCSTLPELQKKQLETLTSLPREKNNSLLATTWVPRSSNTHQNDSEIEKNKQEDSFFIKYTLPASFNVKQEGHNIATDPLQKAIITLSMESGATIATAPALIPAGSRNEKYFSLFAPLYRKGNTPEVELERVNTLRGFLVNAIGFSPLIERSLASPFENKYDFWLYDTTGNDQLVFSSNFSGKALQISPESVPALRSDTLLSAYPHSYIVKHELSFATRHYTLIFAADKESIQSNLTNAPEMISGIVSIHR
jgi:CHASE1-domain containing sensor protein